MRADRRPLPRRVLPMSRRFSESFLAIDRSHALTALWAAATALMVWSFSFLAMVNTDIWFHLAAGRLILSRQSIPTIDPWSYSVENLNWHNHEWLTDVVLYLWKGAFGVESLMYWM